MKEFWNERYSRPEFVYGEEPNEFFQLQLDKLDPGTILLPAEGEGRNAVYAATNGWDVHAFDFSEKAKQKAIALADKNKVTLHYSISDFNDILYSENQFDVIAIIFAHVPTDKKEEYYKKLVPFLKPGGYMILEVFSKNHLSYNRANPQVGGPKDIGMLFSIKEMQSFFPDFEEIILREEVVELKEGPVHSGTGSVIRFVGRKPR